MESTALKPALPLDLRILGVLDVVLGLAAGIEMILSAMTGGPLLNPIVLYVFVGWGLLGRFKGARNMALWLTIVVPLGLLLLSLILGTLLPGLTGVRDVSAPQRAATLLTVVWWLVNIAFVAWQIRVLTSARSRDIYQDEHFFDRLVARRA